MKIVELMPPTTPDYMYQAWLSCLLWASRKQEILDAFKEDTGKIYSGRYTPIERMVDQATGRDEQIVREFVGWFNDAVWGDAEAVF